MSIVSMTGFAEASGGHETLRWRWEAKSVNGRGFDMRLRTPPGFDGLEAPARKLAAERFKRGSLQVSLSVMPGESARSFRVDAAALADAVRIAKQIAAETGLPPARVDGLLALKGVVVQDEAAILDDEARMARDAALLASLATSVDLLAQARANEGARIKAVLNAELGEIESLVKQAHGLAAQQPEALRERLQGSLKELQGGPVSDERVAQEIAMLAVKADVREEIDRLNGHCQEARALMGAQESSGRKLDFLAQEFNREANTLCSKSASMALTRVGLALKAVIDQFREQVQNVE
jgi:uncharacterized protein (TIGR00255 family)